MAIGNSFPRFYDVPGEDLLCEIDGNGQPLLFDRLGLEARIIMRRKAGLRTDAEETALRLLKQITSLRGV